MKKLKQFFVLFMALVMLGGNSIVSYATEENSSSIEYATDEWKNQIRTEKMQMCSF